jgi:hypothetical protein
LVRYGSRFYEKLAFKRQNGKISIAVEFALLSKNHRKRSQKYTVCCPVDQNGASRKTVGTVRYYTVRYGHGTVRSGMVLYGTDMVRYGTLRYGTVLYGTARSGTVRYCTVRYGTDTVRYGHGTDTVDG